MLGKKHGTDYPGDIPMYLYKLSIFPIPAMNRGNQTSYKSLSNSKRRKRTLPISNPKIDEYFMNLLQKPNILMNVVPGSIHGNALIKPKDRSKNKLRVDPMR
jgi:hypothetical protein